MILKTCCEAANGKVVPSMYLFQGRGTKDPFLLECGDDPHERERLRKPRQIYDFAPTVSAIVTSHGHTDHVGALPHFVEDGFNGRIFSTIPTKQITEALLLDNFNKGLVDNVFGLYEPPRKFLERFEVSEGVYATFYPAQGHILGASSILLEFEKEKLRVLFSGDLGNTNKNMLEVTGEVPEADIVIMESTYGRREHHPDFQLSLKEIYDGIYETYQKRGNFHIPILSIHKLQEALYYLNRGKESGEILRDMNIIADSTLGEEITKIYLKESNRQYFTPEAKRFFTDFPTVPFRCKTPKDINKDGRNIILASSGLDGSHGKFSKYRQDLSSENNSVAVLSHRIEGSLLDKIALGKKGRIGTNGDSFHFNAKSLNVESHSLSGFSSHADATQLVNWLEKTKAKYVFLVHGEDKDNSRQMLKQMITTRGLCDEKNIFTPSLLEEYDLTNLHSGPIYTPATESVPTEHLPKIVNGRTEITLLGQKVSLPIELVNS